MRELFLQIVYGRTQSAFSDDGLAVGAGLEDLGKGLRSQVGTMYGTLRKRCLVIWKWQKVMLQVSLWMQTMRVIGYQFVSSWKNDRLHQKR